jgi:hypothetical protein
LKEKNINSKIHWHPGFYGGIELEFIEYKTSLTFDIEHELSKEPLKMDMVVIKKNSDVEIKNQLGRIFRKHNVIEYKSPDDSIQLRDITVTLCRDTNPRKLIKMIKNNGGLVGKEHSALKILSKHAKEEDIRQFVADSRRFKTPGDIHNANAVLQVSTRANEDLYRQIRRNDYMCQALMEIMKDEVDKKVNTAVDTSMGESIKNVMESLHISADEAMDILKIPEEKKKMFLIKL